MPPRKLTKHYRGALVALALFASVALSLNCEDVVDALDGFEPDSCAEFNFWRNDTLLVKNVKVEVARDNIETINGCRSQRWESEGGDSWIHYDIETLCDKFDAEIHVSNRYWEVTTGHQVFGFWFAEGEWKLHEITGGVDKIIDGGTFEFRFRNSGSCP